MNPNTCTHEGCTQPSTARRLCRKHYVQAWRAGQIGQHQKLPSRVSNPTICPPEHTHGKTGTCYAHHQCRCRDCSTARSERDRQRRKLKAYGRFDAGLVDAAPVREHLLFLSEQGMGYKRVARVAGVSTTVVRTIIWGRQDPGPRKGELSKRVRRETAAAILGVQPDVATLAGGALIDARGVRRRLQALVARGWSQSKLADRLGVQVSNFGNLLTQERVSVRTHRAVAALYDELWNVEPPNEKWHDKAAFVRSIRYAKARQWLPPLAWDDIDSDPEPPVVDAPEAVVDDVAVQLACAGERVRLTRAERREAVRVLHGRGLSDSKIGALLGVRPETAFRIRKELNLAAAS